MVDFAKYEGKDLHALRVAFRQAEAKQRRLESQKKELARLLEFLTNKIAEAEFSYVPTQETLDACLNSYTLTQYTSHEQLIADVEAEIEAENAKI